MFRALCAYHQEVKFALHSLWYHHTYRFDDTIGCLMQFWPPDDKHMCSKHVEAWNKLIVKPNFCASCWLITEINISLLLMLANPFSIHHAYPRLLSITLVYVYNYKCLRHAAQCCLSLNYICFTLLQCCRAPIIWLPQAEGI